MTSNSKHAGNYIRKAILLAAATAGFVLAGCSSTNWQDNRGSLATKPAASYSTEAKIEVQTTQAETKNQDNQVAAPTVAMTKHCLGDKQPLLTLENKIMIDATKSAAPHSFYNIAGYDLNSGALGCEKQLIVTPREGMSLYFTGINSEQSSGKSTARKLATQELLKQIKLDKIIIMLPRDLSLYNQVNFNAGIRFGAPDLRDLVQALSGNRGDEKWNEVLSGFKLGGYINYMTKCGNFSIGAWIVPQCNDGQGNIRQDTIRFDAPIMAKYEINF